MKIKLFSHCDLDGVGCAILAYLAFGRENVDVEYCNYKDVDGKVREFYLCSNPENYDEIYITDISVDEEVAAEIDSLVTSGQNWKLFDHHATALGLNQYGWCKVSVSDTITGLKTCGTELFYNYLNDHHKFDGLNNKKQENIKRFVEIVRDYDTWRWKELGEKGLICKQMNDLLDIYGREDFITWTIQKIGVRFEYIPFPILTGMDESLLSYHQKVIERYIEKKDKQLRVATDQFGKTFGYVFAEQYFSELGNRLCELHPEIEYVAMIDISRGTVSFRSVKGDIDLGGEIAHSLGGGGHKKAAGSTFDGGEIGKFVSWSVLNMKPAWSDIMPRYLGEPIKRED